MKYIKFIIPILIIFLTIGFAATNVTLSISGDAYIASDLEDFDVYFSYLKNNGEDDLSLFKSSNEFELVISELGDYKIDFEVTNASYKFDANISLVCDNDLEYTLDSYTFSFDDSSDLEARGSRVGSFEADVVEPLGIGHSRVVSCKIVASPLERTEYGEGDVPDVVNPWAVGTLVTLGTEKFNIISETDTTVTMLAQYNLGTNYRQSSTYNYVSFSNTNGWLFSPGPKEIDIQKWSPTYVAKYVNEYVSYLKSITGDSSLSGDLITMSDYIALGGLGIKDNYSAFGSFSFSNQENYEWFNNGQAFWTKSANPSGADYIWAISVTGLPFNGIKWNTHSLSVRPAITISKEAILNFVQPTLISFTIDDVTYYAEEGMTLGEWVNSGYSNGEFAIGSCYRSSMSSGYCEVDSNGWAAVYLSDLQYAIGCGGSVLLGQDLYDGDIFFLETVWKELN